jgi:asparagine synthase (glutamine-hydrolysing)
MCGFVGVLKIDPNQCDVPDSIILDMVQTIQHRGPDYTGSCWVGPCGLAHARLSIIDLSEAARQPMSNEKGTVFIAYNGEVYNFRELRKHNRLDENGHRFKSNSDTEVIVHLYEEKGIDCITHLNGMYAFALWDSRKRILYLARDPFGIKPLFYTWFKGALWFSSEIKALLRIPDFTGRPNLEAFYHYLSFDYIPGALTAFENIHELRPGHLMTIHADTAVQSSKRFFDIGYPINPKLSEEEAVDQARRLCYEAVERHLISDVPVGVMLSGGIDSSAMTAIMARIRNDSDFHTFSLVFNESSFDESEYARHIAQELGTRHHEILVTPQKVARLLPKYLTFIDEPYADGSAIPTYLLAEKAKDHVTVLLSGEGGDEFFSGYDTHMAYKVRRLYRLIPRFLRTGVIRPLVNRLPVSHKKLSLEFKAKRFIQGAELDIPHSHFFWRVVLSEEAKKTILDDEPFFRDMEPSVHFFEKAYQNCDATDDLNRLLYIDYSYHLPDDLMIKNDRMTMAHSLEARVPFTDKNLVKFLATVPVHLKFKGRNKKHLLKSAMRGVLSPRILNKKKIGLEMPYSQWMLAELRDMVEDVLSPEAIRATGFISSQGVTRLWEEHKQKKRDHGRALWGLINYMLWYRIYIARESF